MAKRLLPKLLVTFPVYGAHAQLRFGGADHSLTKLPPALSWELDYWVFKQISQWNYLICHYAMQKAVLHGASATPCGLGDQADQQLNLPVL